MKKRFTFVKVLWLSALLLLPTFVQAQDRMVNGKVTDAKDGSEVIGASVTIKGTLKAVVTDVTGNFSINAKPQDVLVISFVGYAPQEVMVDNQTSINVSLKSDMVMVDEIVVVGYGTSRKKDLTGATANISNKDFNEGPVTNPLQQIAGKASGVNITQTGSEPGSKPTVRVRGITSLIGGNDPLVVVDGIQGNMDLFNQIPPSEIESFDILKDASATAIYGSRGAPGVILITTKKGKAGNFTVEYSGSTSIDVLSRKLDMMDASQWRTQAKAWKVPASADHGSNTDWYNILTQNGSTQNHTVSFGGANKGFNFRASTSAILQDGIVLNSNYQNYIARIQASQKAFDDKLTLTMNVNSGVEKTKGSPTGVGNAAFRSNLISNAYVSKPTDPVLNTDGSYFRDANVFQYTNPYAVAQTVVNEGTNNNLFGSLRADLEIFEGFTAGWFGSWRKQDRTWGYFAPSKSTIQSAIDDKGTANISNNNQDEKLMDISVDYKKLINDHSFNATLVYEWQNQLYTGNYTQARGFINDITAFNALQLGDITNVKPGDITSYKNDRTLVSYLGRLNYSYLDRYIFTGSLRRDGSSVFGENNKWGNFPSASVAWRLSKESFLENNEIVNDLKLRGGYGVTGNQQGLSPQNSLQLVGGSGNGYMNGNIVSNFGVTQNANKDLKWETRYQTNVGIDFSLFHDRFYGSVDAFTATTKNLLFNYTVPQPPYPYGTIVANVGSLKNEGIELNLAYQVIKTKDMTFTLAGNASFLRNEVLELSGSINGVPLNTDYVSRGYNKYLIKGQPIDSYYILQHSGKDASNAETVVDVDKNGTIDLGDRSLDKKLEGSALPKYTYAFTPSFSYKNFDASMVWRGAGGNKIFNSINSSFSYFENLGKSNLLNSAVDKGLFTSKYSSDLWLEDGSYLRFENLTLGYRFNTTNIKYVSGIRVSFTANNLALFTKYTGLDPEIYDGSDAGIYPRTRSFAIGFNVIFK